MLFGLSVIQKNNIFCMKIVKSVAVVIFSRFNLNLTGYHYTELF